MGAQTEQSNQPIPVTLGIILPFHIFKLDLDFYEPLNGTSTAVKKRLKTTFLQSFIVCRTSGKVDTGGQTEYSNHADFLISVTYKNG